MAERKSTNRAIVDNAEQYLDGARAVLVLAIKVGDPVSSDTTQAAKLLIERATELLEPLEWRWAAAESTHQENCYGLAEILDLDWEGVAGVGALSMLANNIRGLIEELSTFEEPSTEAAQ